MFFFLDREWWQNHWAGCVFLRRHDPMMYHHEVSRGPRKIYYADMSRGLGGICFLEVSSIGSSTCFDVRVGFVALMRLVFSMWCLLSWRCLKVC